MKKLTLYIALAATLSACTKDSTKLNVDPKHPATVPSYLLFTEGERELVDGLTNSNVNDNILRLIEQQWQETTYTDESNYNLNTRSIPDDNWNIFYQSLIQLEKAKQFAGTDISDANTKKFAIAQADILQVYGFYYLVTTFGNIPYSQALNIDKPFPVYDDAATIFADLLKRLDADIAAIPATASQADNKGFAGEIIYAGDGDSWKAFANSMKLKLGMTIADSDPVGAKAAVASAVQGGVFTANSDNAMFAYPGAPPNTNPIWVDLIQSGRQDYVACSTMISYITDGDGSSTDPRTPYFFTTISASNPAYAGLDPGENGSFGSNSKPSGALVSTSIGHVTDPGTPGDILDYSEVEFLLAEAVTRGFISGDASTHYTNAIKASIQFWTAGADDGSVYAAAHSMSTYGSAMEAIAMQKYIALYNRGWDAWIENRRLDYPKLQVPPADLRQSDFPVRFTYPVNEQNVNVVNYKKASTAIGGDEVTTRLWFDTKDIGNAPTDVAPKSKHLAKK